jgi:hypothetical protein
MVAGNYYLLIIAATPAFSHTSEVEIIKASKEIVTRYKEYRCSSARKAQP